MKIVFATGNLNKVKEISELLPEEIEILSLTDIGCREDIPETSPTIEGNAIQKAEYVKKNYGYDCFADDTGLEVEILQGAPGVFSARYAGPQKNAEDNMKKLLSDLENSKNRKATFKTVIALCLNGKIQTFEGICVGKITEEKKGEKGFGYDPIFQPEGYEKTFAELTLEEKNKISHRSRAVRKLIDFINELN